MGYNDEIRLLMTPMRGEFIPSGFLKWVQELPTRNVANETYAMVN
jgi:hypothetical protein